MLGIHQFTFDVARGEIVEADIFFNGAFEWSVVTGGDVKRFDLGSIALHEIGHLVGPWSFRARGNRPRRRAAAA